MQIVKLKINPMEPEFYHKNIFGEQIDFNPNLEEEESSLEPKARPNFNIFTLTEAFGTRRKKEAWLLYQKALALGTTPEEIFWKLTWQLKVLLLAKKTKNASEAGMNPFPYSKAKSALKYWKEGELEDLYENLVVGYHKIRMGQGEAETLIEKLILRI